MTPPSPAAAQAAAYARAVLARVFRSGWPEGCHDITQAVADLRDAIEVHDLLAADRLSWESYDTDLAGYAEPHAVAVDKSAEAAAEHADWLAEITEKHLGRDAAEYVSNGTEQQAAA